MQDLQGEAPYHLLHLKIAAEKNRFLASVEECRAELNRETNLVPQEGSEKIIKEHRVGFTYQQHNPVEVHCYLMYTMEALVWVGKK